MKSLVWGAGNFPQNIDQRADRLSLCADRVQLHYQDLKTSRSVRCICTLLAQPYRRFSPNFLKLNVHILLELFPNDFQIL